MKSPAGGGAFRSARAASAADFAHAVRRDPGHAAAGGDHPRPDHPRRDDDGRPHDDGGTAVAASAHRTALAEPVALPASAAAFRDGGDKRVLAEADRADRHGLRLECRGNETPAANTSPLTIGLFLFGCDSPP